MNPTPSTKTDSSRRGPATTWTKADPYASRIHRRIDLILLAATIIILFLVLRASAHGQTVTINSVAPRVTISGGGGGGGGGVPLGRRKPPVGGDPTWTGPGGTASSPTSGNWSAAGNWTGTGTIPPVSSNTTALVFGGSGSGTYTATDDIAGNFVFGSITLNSTSTGTNTIAASATQLLVVDTTSGSTITQSGSGAFTISNGFTNNNAATLTLTGDGGLVTLSGVIGQKNAGQPTTITKTGLSTFALSGANTYTGATMVNGGKLFVNGSTTSSAFTVSNSGTVLGGSGTIGGSVAFNAGKLAPGLSGDGSTAKLTVGGALTLNSSSTFSLDLNGTTAGTSYDQLIISSTGSVTLGSATLSLNSISNLAVGNKLAILDNQSSQSSASMGTFNGLLTNGSSFSSGAYTFKIFYDGVASTLAESGGNDIILEVTAVPEPGTWLAGALAIFGVALTQRRRLRQLIVKVTPVIA